MKHSFILSLFALALLGLTPTAHAQFQLRVTGFTINGVEAEDQSTVALPVGTPFDMTMTVQATGGAATPDNSAFFILLKPTDAFAFNSFSVSENAQKTGNPQLSCEEFIGGGARFLECFGDIAEGATAVVEASATLLEAVEGEITPLTHNFTSNEQFSRDITTVPGTAPEPVDLAITKTASKDSVFVNDSFEYDLVIRNKGTETAEAIIEDVMPEGILMVFINGAIHAENDLNCNPVETDNKKLSCTATIAAGDSVSIKILVTASVLGIATNTAMVTPSGGQEDENPGDNQSSADVVVTGTILEVAVEVLPSSVWPGAEILVEYTLTNRGPEEARGVVFSADIRNNYLIGAQNPTYPDIKIPNTGITSSPSDICELYQSLARVTGWSCELPNPLAVNESIVVRLIVRVLNLPNPYTFDALGRADNGGAGGVSQPGEFRDRQIDIGCLNIAQNASAQAKTQVGPIDVYFDSVLVWDDLDVNASTGTFDHALNNAIPTIEVVDAGDADNANPIATFNPILLDENGLSDAYTFIFHEVSADSIELIVQQGTHTAPADSNTTEVALVHAVPSASLLRTETLFPNELLADSLAYGQTSAYAVRDPGPGSFRITPLDTGEAETFGFDLAPGEVYTAVLRDDGSGKRQGLEILMFDTQGTPIAAGINTASEAEAGVPETYELSANYPNPFNPTTQIQYALPESSPVALGVYDLTGRLVQMLVSGEQAQGRYQVVWNGRDATGRMVASGVYLYRLTAGEFAETRKMLLLR